MCDCEVFTIVVVHLVKDYYNTLEQFCSNNV